MEWAPLCNYTHYSLLKGYSKPQQLAEKCKANGYKACGIADYKSISGAVSFFMACKSNGIKPIIGCTFDTFTLFAKNKDGWLDLIKLVSSLDEEGNYDKKFLLKVTSKGNLISVADKAGYSPIKGEDFYKRTPALMETYYTN